MADKILLVDDDPAVREFVSELLKKAGFQVRAVESAEEGLEELRRALYDALVLDLTLPGISGIKMCEILKQDPATSQLPVIMLTSHNTERSKVQGLQTGADDYIVKPPAAAELVARVQALLRRSKYKGAPPPKVFESRGIRLDLDRHEAFVSGKLVDLRPKEFKLLNVFLEKKGRVLSRDFLFNNVWEGEVVSTHTLEVHINNLREKLGPLADRLQTVPGVGYKLLD